MKNYEEYKLEDFTCNDGFISWCLQPDEASNQFWSEYIELNPNSKSVILQAKQLILDLNSIEEEENEANFEQEIWSQIEANIIAETSKKPHIVSSNLKHTLLHWAFSIAAILIIIIGISFWLPSNKNLNSNESFTSLQWTNYENNSGLSKTILLTDSSTVILEPFGSLKYPTVFKGEERVVFLKGEAFFDIARDTLHPFMVYANETITKVLGTSFNITAFEGEETVEVDVKSGRVAVYAKIAANENLDNKKQIVLETDERISIPRPNSKLEVTPNQKVIFNKKRAEMRRTVTERPQIITQLEELPQFKFRNESVIKVFEALERVYGIDLEFDVESLEECTITTQLKNEPLFQKLNILCTALDLKIKEQDGVIFIEGEGC